MDKLKPNAPERLTPDPVVAIDGMGEAYLAAFRRSAGTGSGRLAAVAWSAWRQHLLAWRGLSAADHAAMAAACRELNHSSRYRLAVWVTERRVRSAARRASAEATAAR